MLGQKVVSFITDVKVVAMKCQCTNEKECPKVTLGWDAKPTIAIHGGYVFPRAAEEIFHKKFYFPGKEWPQCPINGKELEMKRKD